MSLELFLVHVHEVAANLVFSWRTMSIIRSNRPTTTCRACHSISKGSDQYELMDNSLGLLSKPVVNFKRRTEWHWYYNRVDWLLLYWQSRATGWMTRTIGVVALPRTSPIQTCSVLLHRALRMTALLPLNMNDVRLNVILFGSVIFDSQAAFWFCLGPCQPQSHLDPGLISAYQSVGKLRFHPMVCGVYSCLLPGHVLQNSVLSDNPLLNVHTINSWLSLSKYCELGVYKRTVFSNWTNKPLSAINYDSIHISAHVRCSEQRWAWAYLSFVSRPKGWECRLAHKLLQPNCPKTSAGEKSILSRRPGDYSELSGMYIEVYFSYSSRPSSLKASSLLLYFRSRKKI